MKKIDLFWFKRDLRLFDNAALKAALESRHPTVLVYFYESSVWNDDHYSERHWNFVQESLIHLNGSLMEMGTKINALRTEVIPFLESLNNKYDIQTIFSSEETGLKVTYDRDIAVQQFCSANDIKWREFQNNGVIRGIYNRDTWRKAWYGYMSSPISPPNFEKRIILSETEVNQSLNSFEKVALEAGEHSFQKGGRTEALEWMDSFFSERLQFYTQYISKPENSRYGCSRLSPYLSWGNLSIREVYQKAMREKHASKYKRALVAFNSRLRWQSHFIQKFEQEPRMEFEAVNKGFLSLNQPLNSKFVTLWKEGRTGYPLVDASLRCVAQTGYINFRMRSMVTSFLTHHLFQHFTTGGPWLARQFLDFEPGIHYGQLQMQAGFTGTNTVRVYNPVKNAHEHDSEAVFIKKYVPELRGLPANLAIEPWTITPMEALLYTYNQGVDYPERIVDITVTRKVALQNLYGQRQSELAKSEKERILETHTIRRKEKR